MPTRFSFFSFFSVFSTFFSTLGSVFGAVFGAIVGSIFSTLVSTFGGIVSVLGCGVPDLAATLTGGGSVLVPVVGAVG